MGGVPGIEMWGEFEHDPRAEANAGLRASDRDRDLVQSMLVDGFAEGRLDREEYDERSEALRRCRTLDELPRLVADLPVAAAPWTPAATTSAPIAERATQSYRRDLRQAVWAFLSASLICWVIWGATGFGGAGWDASFPWPIFVSLGTGINVGRVLFQKEEIIDGEVQRLERKQRKALEKKNPPEQESP